MTSSPWRTYGGEARTHRHLAGTRTAGRRGRDDGGDQGLGRTIPILGVCLGHQAIGAVFGGAVVRAGVPMHGKTSTIEHDGRGVFSGISGPFPASRYHSLVVAEADLPGDLEVSARTREDGVIMGLRHRTWPVHGVQFHPESILTGEGRKILENFIGDRCFNS